MYEIHVTIEPVPADLLALATSLAERSGFKLADLLMRKENDEYIRSSFDTFMTGHTTDYREAENMTILLCNRLSAMGFKVWRYKIEHIILDSKYQVDPLRLLTK